MIFLPSSDKQKRPYRQTLYLGIAETKAHKKSSVHFAQKLRLKNLIICVPRRAFPTSMPGEVSGH
ncbi:MAG: hypothetical protein ACP5KG_05830 [Myxococcota bacterium]